MADERPAEGRHMAHVLDRSGVTETPFVRDGAAWSNAEPITLAPGAVLDIGAGLTITNGQSVRFTYGTFFDEL